MTPHRQSLPHSERLRDSREFAALRQHGRRSVGRFVIVNALESLQRGRRLGIVTSRKLGSAVTRSHARRWLREIYRRHKHQLKPNLSLIVVARQALARTNYRELQAELLGLFHKVGALSNCD